MVAWRKIDARDFAFAVPLLLQRVGRLMLERFELVSHDEASTGVPAEDGVIIAWGTKILSFFVTFHGFQEMLVGDPSCSGSSAMEARFSSALGNDAAIIRPIVFTFQSGEDLTHFAVADAIAFSEPVGNGQQQCDEGFLVVRINLQDVKADAFRLGGFVKKAVTHGLLESGRDASRGEGFQLEVVGCTHGLDGSKVARFGEFTPANGGLTTGETTGKEGHRRHLPRVP